MLQWVDRSIAHADESPVWPNLLLAVVQLAIATARQFASASPRVVSANSLQEDKHLGLKVGNTAYAYAKPCVTQAANTSLPTSAIGGSSRLQAARELSPCGEDHSGHLSPWPKRVSLRTRSKVASDINYSGWGGRSISSVGSTAKSIHRPPLCPERYSDEKLPACGPNSVFLTEGANLYRLASC